MAKITAFQAVDNQGNEITYRVQDRGEYPFKWPDGSVTTELLYNADPDCEHEAVPNKWSGIACRKCGGWFCY